MENKYRETETERRRGRDMENKYRETETETERRIGRDR